MYEKSTYRWYKHWDFTLLDMVCMELAFWLAVLVKAGGSLSWGSMIYGRISVALIALNVFVVFFNESYKGILKRGHQAEL